MHHKLEQHGSNKNNTIDWRRRKIMNQAENNEETFKPSRKKTKMKKY